MIFPNSQVGKLWILENVDFNLFKCRCACGNEVVLTEEEIESQTCSKACSHLRGETCAADILDALGLKYEVQTKIDGMNFDFYLPEVGVVIECDGAQHWRTQNNDWKSEYKLQETRARDIRKDEICKKNGLVMFRLPFWELNEENAKKFVESLDK